MCILYIFWIYLYTIQFLSHSTDGSRKYRNEAMPPTNMTLIDASYYFQKFNEYEKYQSWGQAFQYINVESDRQKRALGLGRNLSRMFTDKNRYRDILPYDQNRVTLKCVTSERDSYINASPLQMPFARRNYILTQAPLPNTANDFWQMVYEQRVSICVMFTNITENGYVKSHAYFPTNERRKLRFANFEVELESEQIKPNYIVRRIKLTPLDGFKRIQSAPPNAACATVSRRPYRIIQHFQYLTWPDTGVPLHTDHFLEFLEDVRTARRKFSSRNGAFGPAGPPVVVHCSAGIGRTGTFVIADTVISILQKGIKHPRILAQLLNEQRLNSMEAFVVFIRRYRMGLVQTPWQFRFAWKTVIGWIKKNGDKIRNNQKNNFQRPR